MKRTRLIAILLVVAFLIPVVTPLVTAHELDPGEGGSSHMRFVNGGAKWDFEITRGIWKFKRTSYESVWINLNMIRIEWEDVGTSYNIKSYQIDFDVNRVTNWLSIHYVDTTFKISGDQYVEDYYQWLCGPYDSSQDFQFAGTPNVIKSSLTVYLEIIIHMHDSYDQRYFDLIFRVQLAEPDASWTAEMEEVATGQGSPDIWRWLKDAQWWLNFYATN